MSQIEKTTIPAVSITAGTKKPSKNEFGPKKAVLKIANSQKLYKNDDLYLCKEIFVHENDEEN
jgi:hypothetical protein